MLIIWRFKIFKSDALHVNCSLCIVIIQDGMLAVLCNITESLTFDMYAHIRKFILHLDVGMQVCIPWHCRHFDSFINNEESETFLYKLEAIPVLYDL